MSKPIIYPIGYQSFEKLRREHALYVDKTEYVYQLVSRPACYFLSRPRRFGKSLLLSTIEAFYLGKKDLFAGLKISEHDIDWKEYPVLHFDFSRTVTADVDSLNSLLAEIFQEYAGKYGVKIRGLEAGIGAAFGFLIQDISQKVGEPVVILIDEYDKGLNEIIKCEQELERMQYLLRPFFSQLKAMDQYIKFSMITGVARFRHLTIFSELNNLSDISLAPDYASICGISVDELHECFAEGIQHLAQLEDKSQEEVVQKLVQKYDGYRFTRKKECVLNPFDLLNAFDKGLIGDFWILSGASKAFMHFLTRANIDIDELTRLWVSEDSLSDKYDSNRPIPLLFQTGYLTIKDYEEGYYLLDIPNGEVRNALVRELMPAYMGINGDDMRTLITKLGRYVRNGEVELMLKEIQSLLASVSHLNLQYDNLEKSYHLMLYIIFVLLGIDTGSEISVSGGRIDMVAKTPKFVYVMEFKLNGTAAEAMEQINSKGYALPWSSDNRKVYKIGIAFSAETHTISGWVIETVG